MCTMYFPFYNVNGIVHVSLYKKVHICLFVTIRGKSIEGEVLWILAKEL